MKLNATQKRQMFDEGYVHVPGVVPAVMVREALRAINHSLGHEGMNKDDFTTLRSQTYCREITATPVITDLWNRTPAPELAESLVGEGTLPPVNRGQIALRFPSLADAPATPGGHIDGMYTPHNGVTEGTISHFTMLGAVFLSDVVEPDTGNFTVWPGTHRLAEAYFREHTPQSLLKGMPKITMPPPKQIIARAGDLVLTHYQLVHSVASHLGPNIRYAIFFRLKCKGHDQLGWDSMTDIWAEWQGMRECVTAAAIAAGPSPA